MAIRRRCACHQQRPETATSPFVLVRDWVRIQVRLSNKTVSVCSNLGFSFREAGADCPGAAGTVGGGADSVKQENYGNRPATGAGADRLKNRHLIQGHGAERRDTVDRPEL